MASTKFSKPVSTHAAPVDITSSLSYGTNIKYYDGSIRVLGDLVCVTIRVKTTAAISANATLINGVPPAKDLYGNIFEVRRTNDLSERHHALTSSSSGTAYGFIRLYNNTTESLISGGTYSIQGCYFKE